MLSLAMSASVASEEESFNILEASIPELQSALTSGKLTSRRLVEYYLARIDAYDNNGPNLNSISTVNADALTIADKLDAERTHKGTRGPLHGIPVIVKDNYETTGMPTTAGSVIFADWQPGHDSYLVKRLRDAGAIILAKTNMHEYAMGLKTVGSLFGQTRNPYALDRYPGGSSGGTAAAIAANLAAVGMGSDTCGSIRIPAAQNNLVGLRGTQGLASRAGIFPLSHTLDFGGPLARSVTDIAIVFDAIAGYDPDDPQTAASIGNIPKTYTTYLQTSGLSGARLGLLKELWIQDPEDSEVAQIIETAAEDMKEQGAEIIEVTIPDLKDLMGGLGVILMEFKFDLHDYLTEHPGAPVGSIDEIISNGNFDLDLDPKLRRAQSAGTLDSKEYLQLIVKRNHLKQAIQDTMARHQLDALVYPSSRRKAARIGQEQYGNNCFLSSNSGLPAISVPAGFTKDGVPAGVELLARPWKETTLLKLAYSYEQATRHRRLPSNTPAIIDE